MVGNVTAANTACDPENSSLSKNIGVCLDLPAANQANVLPGKPTGLIADHWNRFPLSFNPNNEKHSAGYGGKVHYSIYAHDDATLHNPSGVMVVVPGMHLSDDFVTVLARHSSQENNQVVYVLNPRGQGVSADKNVPATHQLTVPIDSHVQNLTHLLEDDILPAHKNKPVHVLGHSYGGLILMHALTTPEISRKFNEAGVKKASTYAPFICPSRRARLLGAVAPMMPWFNFPLDSIELLCHPRVNEELNVADKKLGSRYLSFSFYAAVMDAQKELAERITKNPELAALSISLNVILPGDDVFIDDSRTKELFQRFNNHGQPVNITIMPKGFNHTGIFDLTNAMADHLLATMSTQKNMCP